MEKNVSAYYPGRTARLYYADIAMDVKLYLESYKMIEDFRYMKDLKF